MKQKTLQKNKPIISVRNSMAALFVVLITLMSTNIFAQTTDLVKFTFNGLSAYGPSPLTPSVTAANITAVGLTRGSGLGTINTAAANAWGGTAANTAATQSVATSSNNVVTFSLTANTGYKLSLTQIPAYNIRRSGTGFSTGIWQYSINGGSFNDIGSSITWTSTSTSGVTQPSIALSGISALQNVAAGNTITLRVVLWGASATGGTWYFYQPATGSNDLIVNGTVASASVAPTPTCSANITASGATTFCQGGNVTLTANSGSSYLWSNGATTQSISATAAGSYTVRVIDAAGTCTNTSSATVVTVNSIPLASITTANSIICNGGSLTLSANSASSYLWSNGATTQTTSVSAAGSYSVTVTDANGCSATSAGKTVSISTPSASITANGATTFCQGDNVTLTANSGSSYLWSNNATTQAITVSTAGTYSVRVTNANGCSANSSSQTIVVNSLPVASISANGSTSLCNGGNVVLTANSANSYLWSNGATAQSISVNTAGSYSVQVTDANGCSNTSELQDVAVYSSPNLNISATNTLLCLGQAVTLTAKTLAKDLIISEYVEGSSNNKYLEIYNGTGASVNLSDYRYQAFHNGATSPTFNVQLTGTLLDGASIVYSNSGAAIYSGQNTSLGLSLSYNGNDAFALYKISTSSFVDIFGVIGQDPVTAWTNGSYTTKDKTLRRKSTVHSGVTVNPTNGFSTLAAEWDMYNTDDVSGLSSHSINDVNYTWSNNSTNNSITETPTVNSVYSISGTDLNGCTSTSSITINVTNIVASSSASSILCNGGTAVVNVSANGGSGAYFGTGDNTVTAGSYSYTVTDANGCSANTTIVVSEPTALVASSSASSILCNGGSAVVSVSANGGTAPYTGTGDYNVTAGSYSYTVTDANGCSANTTIVVSEPTALVASSSASSILCSGGTAVVSVSANGGTGVYVGTGDNTVTAGSYSYTVTDANGCSANTTITVSEPTALVASSSASSILCNGGSAVVSVSANGGSGVYVGTGDNTVTAGSYSYTVTDANGCTSTTNITVTEPTPLVATITSNAPNTTICNGGTAVLSASISGGLGNINYQWQYQDNSGNWLNVTGTGWSGTNVSSPFTSSGRNASPSTTRAYRIVVTSVANNQCSVIATQLVTVIADPVFTITSTNISCFGANNGTATAVLTGGLALNYGYNWFSDDNISTNNNPTGDGTLSVNGLFPAQWVINTTVSGSNFGCYAQASVNITQPALLVASSISGSILCNGGSTNVTVSANGGTAPYTGTGDFNVTAGSYSYTVTDANGCSANTTIVVSEPNALVASSSASSILCNGGTAVVNVSANGGSGAYFGTGDNTVTAGSYSYTVTDANGCSANTTIVVSEPTALVASSSASSILCNGGSAVVSVSANGGTGVYVGTGDNTVTAGSYSYTVTDANGCSASTSIVVSEPTALVASSSASSILCNGGSAVVSVSANGGTGVYVGTGDNTVTAGSYSYTVTDANGCSANTSINVSEPTALVASSSASSILCNGGSAVVSVSANGGTGVYVGTGDNTVSAGSYSYTVTDANGCSANTTIVVSEPTALVASSSASSILCNGGSAVVSVSANGGTGVYVGTGDNTVTAGSYSYTVTDANGCSANTSINVSEPTALVASSSASSILCNGGSAVVSVSANGGTGVYVGTGDNTVSAGSYSYTVTDANGCSANTTIVVSEPTALVASSSASSILCNGGSAVVSVSANGGSGAYFGTGDNTVTAGSYSYTVTDANGCSANTTIVVSEPTAINVNVTATNLTCNAVNSTVTISASNGTAPYIGTGTFVRPAGTYSYTITDANGCSVTQSYTINQPAVITLSSSSPTIACHGGNTTLTLTANAGNGPYTFIMNGNQNDDDDDDDDDHDGNHNDDEDDDDEDDDDDDDHDGNTTILSNNSGLFNVTAGTYQFTVIDANGCSATTTITVTAPAALLTSVSKSTILCNGGTSNVVVTASGGTAPYNGTGTFIRTAGNYNFTVTDANGCSVVKSITITQPSALVVNAGVDQIVYTGYQNCKTLKATKTGGTGSVNYVWSNGVTNANNTVCPTNAASYTVTATDSKGCVATDVVNVCAVNVVCYAGNSNVQKVEICHQGNTLCVSVNAVAAHLAHGCSLGSCAEANACNNLSSRMVINESTSDETVMSEIKLFPNPAKDNLMVTLSNFEEMGSVSYSIINAIGQEVYTGTLNSSETTINISTLNSGMYYFRTNTQTTKPIIFVVQ